MKMERKFNTLKLEEYFYFIDNHKSYKDFNTLGLYRSIIENENLNELERILVRDYAHKYFKKSFNFLQIKDPYTYIAVSTIAQELTKGDEEKLWNDVYRNQKKILKDKKIKHRNFGFYSKHNCGYDTCPMNGMMIKQGSWMAEFDMAIGNKNKWMAKVKSNRNKSERKREKQIIENELSDE